MTIRESYIEKKVCEYAKSKGWLNFKFVSPQNRGVPDRLFIKDGRTVYIEFKAPDKDTTPIQKAQHQRMARYGVIVFVCDDIQQGKDYVASL